MGAVAREIVEKAGINVEELLSRLVAAAGAEFTTFYYYTILRVSSIGMEGEGLKEIIEDARIEDRTTSRRCCLGFMNWAGSYRATSENLRTFLDVRTPICPTA